MSARSLSGCASQREMGHQSGVAGTPVRSGALEWSLRRDRGGARREVVRARIDARPAWLARAGAYGRGRVLPAGLAEAHGWSESGRVPLAVGPHGTPVSSGPTMPPS